MTSFLLNVLPVLCYNAPMNKGHLVEGRREEGQSSGTRKGKVVAILQPVYLPWMGYFEQVAYADEFVFMDDVQYTKRDWRNRNRIKTATGSIWLTVPVKRHHRGALINDIEINYAENWVRRHLRSIELNYRNCRYFQPLFGDIADIMNSKPAMLVDLNCRLINLLCRYLDIDTPTVFSSEVPVKSPVKGADAFERKNRRIIDICRYFRADILYDGASAADFIDVNRFRSTGIQVVFQSYQHPCYPQAFGDFIARQSAIDLIMNTGKQAGSFMRSSPVPKGLLQSGDGSPHPC